jgi:hypothetical protein
MKKTLILRTLLATLLLLGPLPASADVNFPLPPEPSWWKQTGLTDVRYGQWLPCRAEWNITNDCLQGINIYALNGDPAGSLTYKVPTNFDPMTARQEWLIVDELRGGKIENSAYIRHGQDGVAHWILPDGITNSDGTKEVNAYLHLMLSGLQINTTAENMVTGSLPEGYYFEFVLKSANFGKQIKWVLSNVRDPQVRLEKDLIIIKGLPDKSPSANFNDPVCEPNELKALSSQRNMAVNMIYFEPGRKAVISKPDDVVLGTNGWWCLSDFHFDPVLQQIIVKVGNVHYDEFGVEIQGWMELKIKGERARQWWGMKPEIAAAYAKVEITYQNGTSKVATVSSNYDAKNDWINLRAYGFTYSNPQLAVSFKKPVQTVVLKKSITCLKGKTSKKVTAVAPKCPAGYKKK